MLMLCISCCCTWAQEEDDTVVVRDVSLTVTKAGTLTDLLKDMTPKTITGLKITGNLNGSDIFTIRELCTNHDYVEDNGLLHKLDLSDAHIVAGGESYYDDVDYGGDGTSKFTEDNVIGDLMFYQCSLLDTLYLPKDITAIGKSAFEGIGNIQELEIPETVKKIGEAAFRSCSALQIVNIPEGVDTIASRTFGYCSALSDIELPSTLKFIAMGGFMKTGLESVTIPEGVDSLAMGAFMTCESLRTIHLPSTLHGIANAAFANEEALDSVYISATVPPIGTVSAFGSVSDKAVLVVPQESLAAYQNSPVFKVFNHIVEQEQEITNALVLRSTSYNNTYDLEQNLGKKTDVVIVRPIKADQWDAIALPFSLSKDEVQKYFGSSTVLSKIERLGETAKGEPEYSIVIKDTTAIEAGTPYLIKATTASDSIRFKDVTIETSTGKTQMLTDNDDLYSYAYGYFSCADMLSSGAYLIQPDGTLKCAPTAASGLELYETPGFYVSFYLPDSWGSTADVKLIHESVSDGISNIKANNSSNKTVIYTLSGMSVKNSRNLSKGLYIVNGKKMIVR